MAKITIFGLAGTGKSTAGKQLADDLGYSYHSSGNMFREYAENLDVSLYQFVEICSKDPSYDRKLDEEVKHFGQKNDNFIFEGRLAWYFIPDSFKIKFICDFNERIKRVAKRDGTTFDQAKRKTVFREETGVKSYERTYGIKDFAPNRLFNIIIDTTTKPVNEIIAEIKKSLKFV